MRTLVVLAVIGVCSGGYQAYNPGYGYGVQPKYVGPVASVIPAGVDGKIIPVSDTYEVAAAKDAFFKAYNDQLDVIKSRRYGTPGYASTLPVYKASVAPAFAFASGGAYGAPAVTYGAPAGSYKNFAYHGPPTQVPDTPEVSAAKHEFFKLYNKQAAAAAAAPDLYTYH
ncbi:cuticle protein CP1499-like [Cherax quadricarinatus]|uniref:cuticle protein CP1499-like n=1 Tax=Cherax quadricarinatus TaxID=27406 RepID=UPI00387E7A20